MLYNITIVPFMGLMPIYARAVFDGGTSLAGAFSAAQGIGAIVGGVAAKVIRQRFPKAISQALEDTAWWDWDHETLTERMADFKDLRTFLAKYAP